METVLAEHWNYFKEVLVSQRTAASSPKQEPSDPGPHRLEYRFHVLPSNELLEQLLKTRYEEEEFLEILYNPDNLLSRSSWLISRSPTAGGRREYILKQEVRLEAIDAEKHEIFWEQLNGKARIEKYLQIDDIDQLEPVVAWETTRYKWAAEHLWVDFVHWAHRGQFGAYTVATFKAASPELRTHWVPCASKYVAVLHSLAPNLLQSALKPAEKSKNEQMLGLNPPHNGKDGRLPFQFFPKSPPMNAAELALILDKELEALDESE